MFKGQHWRSCWFLGWIRPSFHLDENFWVLSVLLFLSCFFWLFYCDQICLSRCSSFVPLIFRWVSCHFQSCLIVFLFGCHAFSWEFLLLHIIFFLGSLFSSNASLLCFLGWVFFSEVWWFGVRYFLPFMIVIVLDELFFFHHNLHYFDFFGSVVVSFLDVFERRFTVSSFFH